MHIKAARQDCRELFFFFFFAVCENDGDPLISQNDLRPFAASLPLLFLSFSIFGLLRGSLMRTHKTEPLLPALPLPIMELFWRLCLRLIFQPHMLALFHLSLPSPSLACDCRRGRNTPRRRPLEEAGLSARVVSVTLTLTDARRISGVFLQQSGFIRFTEAYGQKGPVAAAQRHSVVQHCHRL